MPNIANEVTVIPDTMNAILKAVTPQKNNKAAAILAGEGLTLADAYERLIDHIIMSGGLPCGLEEPNELTCQTLEKIEKGEELHHAKDFDDLLQQLGN